MRQNRSGVTDTLMKNISELEKTHQVVSCSLESKHMERCSLMH